MRNTVPFEQSPPRWPAEKPQGDQLLEHLGRPLPAGSVQIRIVAVELAPQIKSFHGPDHQVHAGMGVAVLACEGNLDILPANDFAGPPILLLCVRTHLVILLFVGGLRLTS